MRQKSHSTHTSLGLALDSDIIYIHISIYPTLVPHWSLKCTAKNHHHNTGHLLST